MHERQPKLALVTTIGNPVSICGASARALFVCCHGRAIRKRLRGLRYDLGKCPLDCLGLWVTVPLSHNDGAVAGNLRKREGIATGFRKPRQCGMAQAIGFEWLNSRLYCRGVPSDKICARTAGVSSNPFGRLPLLSGLMCQCYHVKCSEVLI